MRVLIIGAGVVGAMTAWRLAKAGHEVQVFEQFELDHDRGSSYGDSRIVRRVYPDPFYTDLMADAYPLWHELQAQSEHELFNTVGGVMFGPSDHKDMIQAEAALADSGVPFERLSAAQTRERFPALRLREDEIALFEPSMSYARASRCVKAAVELAQKHGAKFRFQTAIASIREATEGIELKTEAGETFHGDRLLICAGPWAPAFLKKAGVTLPIQVVRKTYLHLLPRDQVGDFEVGRFPLWIDAVSLAYGFPRLGEVPGVKLAFHGGGEVTSPDAVRRELDDDDRQELLAYVAKRFPGLSSQIVHEKVCLYSNTPDEDFIVDGVPGLQGAFFIAGLSGHGFKFAPLLGEIAVRMLTDEEPAYDLSRFALTRFTCDG